MKLIRIQLGIDIKLICFLRERERERERNLSFHSKTSSSFLQLGSIQSSNSKYDGQYNRDIISSTAWEKEFIFNQGF